MPRSAPALSRTTLGPRWGVARRIVPDHLQQGELGEAALRRRAAVLEHGAEAVAGLFQLVQRGADHVRAQYGGGRLAERAGLHLLGEVGDGAADTIGGE